jgi:hypothetical protein
VNSAPPGSSSTMRSNQVFRPCVVTSSSVKKNGRDLYCLDAAVEQPAKRNRTPIKATNFIGSL